MSLREYLQEKKVDQIQDDEEFCNKEYEAVMQYCKERKFLVTDDDLKCIVDRGLNDSYEYMREEFIKHLWMDFGDVSMNPETECIDEKWNGFQKGTHREEVWNWFEEVYKVSIGKDLMGL